MIVFSSVDLPAPLRPSSATISCSCTVERRRRERCGSCRRTRRRRAAPAAPALQPARHARAAAARAPRRLCRCRSPAPPCCWRASSAVPSTSTRPLFITVTRSASANTRSMSCSTSSTGMSAEMRLIRLATRSRSAAASPASGSSSSSTRGPDASARPMSSRRWPPYDSVPASARSMPLKPRKRISSAVRRVTRSIARTSDQPLKCDGSRACTARRRFSSIDTPENRLVIWNERASPAATVRCGARPGDRTRRRASTLPRSGANIPEIRLNTVVLPAPLGPISACSVRAARRSRHRRPPGCRRTPSRDRALRAQRRRSCVS